MTPFIRNAVSYVVERAEAYHPAAADSLCDDIVSGYTYPLTGNHRASTGTQGEPRQRSCLHADIVDYQQLVERDDEGILLRLVGVMKIMEAYISANHGRLVRVTGDSVLAEFDDAENALDCAINMRLSDRRRNAVSSAESQIRFRIGVFAGDLLAEREDGNAKAARPAIDFDKPAHHGSICVAAPVKLRLANNPSFKFIELGKQYLQSSGDPVEIFWIEFRSDRIEQLDDRYVADVAASAG